MSTAAEQNAGGGCGYHLITSAETAKLAGIETDKIAGHQLKVFAYGSLRSGETVQLFANGSPISTAVKLETSSFIFDAIVVIDAVEGEIAVQVTAPLTDTNTRLVVTQLHPSAEIVFELRSVTGARNFQVWKLGL